MASQLEILGALAKGPKTVNDLAATTGGKPASIRQILRRIRVYGHVRREAQNIESDTASGREFVYHITVSGQKRLSWLKSRK